MTRRPKVLYIPLWYPSKRTKGVSGVFNREHVMAMKPYVDVTVLHFMTDYDRKGLRLDMRSFEDEGVLTYEITTGLSPIPKTSIFSWSYNLYRAIKMVIAEIGRPEILHAQDDNSWVVGRYARKHGIPYVISQHWTKILKGNLKWYEKELFKKSFKHACAVLPAQQNSKEAYKKFGLEANVIWLPNTYNPDVFYVGEVVRENILVHVSGMTPQKRVYDIVRAFGKMEKRYPDAKLILVGDGPNKKDIVTFVRENGLQDKIIFTGFLPKSEVARWMQKAKGFVFPSSYETFGCVLMEAMACGTPVLTTRVGGIPGVVPDEAHGILVEVGDIRAIAEGKASMLEDKHQLDTLKIAEEMKERFSMSAVGRRIAEIYHQCLNGSSGK